MRGLSEDPAKSMEKCAGPAFLQFRNRDCVGRRRKREEEQGKEDRTTAQKGRSGELGQPAAQQQ